MNGSDAVHWSSGGSGTLHDSTVSGVLRMTGAGTSPVIEWNHLRGACILVDADGGAHEDQPQPILRENEINGCPGRTDSPTCTWRWVTIPVYGERITV